MEKRLDKTIAYRLCIYALMCVLVLVSIAFVVERARLERELKAEREVAKSALEVNGFYRAKIVSQWRLNRTIAQQSNSAIVKKVREAGLRIAAIENASAKLTTKTVAKPIIPDIEGEPQKTTVGCLFIPWTDGRLTIESYDPPTNVLTYSLSQRFKLVGTYLADEKGTIQFGKLELYEIASPSRGEEKGEGKIIGKAELTDYELLAAKPPSARWRPQIGVMTGVEVGLDDEQIAGFNPLLGGVLIGAQIGFKRLSIFGMANIKVEPTVILGVGWRW